MRILFFGDIVGKPGRQALKEQLPALRREHAADVVIANGENASGGIGLTAETLRELLGMGIDILTTGNHVWKHRDLYGALDKEPRLLRPANYPAGAPGRGLGVYDLPGGHRLAVLNLCGTTYMDPLDCPFRTAETLLARLEAEEGHPLVRLVDFHAEATSEKKALGWFLDGRVSAVIGTHTHVQTADAMLLPGGTAYLTDAGMCGVEASVLGMDHKVIVDRFLTRLPQRFRPATGRGSLNGVLLDVDEGIGRARSIRALRVACPAAEAFDTDNAASQATDA
ncbi:YmdB family metallophosphoesterase [Nitratidesulfovibrio sp. SRB-5]|uniref:TIGR00282 family metallophosphoesterase n=1 Tax=Nitratidesulfovibrio sp. SRB-5 TaxID=2872636 RepID=UPI00102773BD|nr:TIGR00282 family metallophosphoesterase [Nitratidesulfovibrio sp. SRB-5]MBZ2172486.1 YmdB family metallophosphoesterase [Nitratidesulfovibrio sp. SRB-5]RXF77784.1 YmdB family metallophosphoesterase [Desulfovibrio sp. DS-1]